MPKMSKKVMFETEIEEFLKLKSKSTQTVYRGSFNEFLAFYRNKHGEGTNFGHFLDRIFAEQKKPRRKQKRLAETDIVDFVNWLKDKKRSNNTIRSNFSSVQNFLKFKGIAISSLFVGNLPPSTTLKKKWETQMEN